MRGERIATALVFGVLVALLIVATGAARQASRSARAGWAYAAQRDGLVIELGKQLRDTQAAYEQRPIVEKLIVQPCPQVRDVGHVTPLFGRDSQLSAGR